MSFFRIVTVLVGLVALLMVVRFAYMARSAPTPTDLGARAGRLAPCPDKPNCVSSQAERSEQQVEALAVDGARDQAVERAVATIDALPRARVTDHGNGYLRAEFRSRLFRFVDDLELVYDPRVPGFQVRSASRTGYSDLGANRRHVEALRSRLR